MEKGISGTGTARAKAQGQKEHGAQEEKKKDQCAFCPKEERIVGLDLRKMGSH